MQSMLRLFLSLYIILLLFIMPGCAVIGGIFKAGVWVGVLMVLFVIVLIVWLVGRGSNKR